MLYTYSYGTTKEMVIHTALTAGREMDKRTTIVSTNNIGSHEPMNVSGTRCVFLSHEEIQELANNEGRIEYFEYKTYIHLIFYTTVMLNHLTMFPEEEAPGVMYGEGTKYVIFYDITEGKWVCLSTMSWIT